MRYLGSMWSIGFVLLLLSGCGQATGNVSGKVSFGGKPLPSGRVTFLCEGGEKPALSAQIGADGTYSIPQAPTGQAKVLVETFPPQQFRAVPGMPAYMLAPGAAGAGPSAVASGGPGSEPGGPGAAPPASNAGPYLAIPKKYASVDQSGLTYQITSGQQTKDIELTP